MALTDPNVWQSDFFVQKKVADGPKILCFENFFFSEKKIADRPKNSAAHFAFLFFPEKYLQFL